MDSEAMGLLAEIHKKAGADFLADTPMTKYFAAEARRLSKRELEEEKQQALTLRFRDE